MNETAQSTVQISVYESTLPLLIAMKQSPEDPLADVIQRSAKYLKPQKSKPTSHMRKEEEWASKAHCQHEALILGSVVSAKSFGELYGKLIDVLSDVADDAVEKLARMKARSRRYVAMLPSNIHPGSPHLPTLRTESGWYVSMNIGREDFCRGARALCEAAEIEYGNDVQLLR